MDEEATTTGQDDQTQTTTGTDPAKTDGEQTTFDASKLSDADFEKIFSDNRLYQHSRFKTLSEKAKKADELERKQSQADEERLKSEKKWEELAQKNEQKAKEYEAKYQETSLNSAIQAEAVKQGVVDVDAAVKLLDRTNVKIEEDGSVSGVTEAVTSLLEAKAYLKGSNTTTVGSGSNPNPTQTEAGTKKFKLSQLQDHKFYNDHAKDIAEALKLGLVEDDMNQAQSQSENLKQLSITERTNQWMMFSTTPPTLTLFPQ